MNLYFKILSIIYGNLIFFLCPILFSTIVNMDVAISSESEIAMGLADTTGASVGESDNRNGQALLNLQNSKIVGGSKSFNDAYAAMVSTIGTKTATLKSSSTTQANVVTQLSNQQHWFMEILQLYNISFIIISSILFFDKV